MKAIPELVREHLIAPPLRKALKALTCLGLTICCASSCGILGNKKEASRNLAQQGTACLDQLGPLSNAFIAGTVSEATWGATWDCVDSTMDLFKKFIKGSAVDGYSPDDLRALMQNFLFSRGTVTPTFVDGMLAIKASLFGGTEKSLSNSELDGFRALARFLKVETTVLIPHLRNRNENPTPDNLRALAVAIETFGVHFATYLNTDGNQKLTIDQAVKFTTELAKLAFATDPATVENWTRLGQEVKTLLVRGASDGVAGADWTKILEYGFRLAGPAIAYSSFTGDDPQFQIEMINKVQAVLNTSVTEWGGELPYSQFEKIINVLPNSALPQLAEEFRNGAKAILHERVVTANGKITHFRPALSHLLQTSSDTGVDAPTIDRLINLYRTGMRANSHLKGIYASTKEDLLPADFTARALAYMGGLGAEGTSDVNRLITIANRYPGLYPSNTPEILFLTQDKHSLNNLSHLNWYELVASFLLNSYGSSSTALGKAGTVDDVSLIFDDFNLLFVSLRISHPLKPNAGPQRFLEANLFMPNANGDDKMDLIETTEFLAYIFSDSALGARITNLTLTGDQPCPTVGWDVPLKLLAYPMQCFRDRFTANTNEIFMNMPHLKDELARMTPAERATWDQNYEISSKSSGYNDSPITTFDVGSYAGMPQYAESVMLRFDTNHDGVLDRRETLNNVFPVFKQELASLSGIKIDFLNKAVLLYLMQHGKKPNIGDLLGWALGFEFLKDFQARRIRIYQIFAAIAVPSPADPISQTPPNEFYGSSVFGLVARNLVLGLTPVNVAPPPPSRTPTFNLNTVDPAQLEGYSGNGPVIDPASPYQDALEVLPQDL